MARLARMDWQIRVNRLIRGVYGFGGQCLWGGVYGFLGPGLWFSWAKGGFWFWSVGGKLVFPVCRCGGG